MKPPDSLHILLVASSPHPLVEEFGQELRRKGLQATSVGVLSRQLSRIGLVKESGWFLLRVMFLDPILALKMLFITIRHGLLDARRKDYVHFLALASMIAGLQHRHGFDIVHAFWAYPAGISSVLAKSAMRKPVVVSVLGYDADEHTLKNPGLREITKLALDEADAVVAGAESLRSNVLQLGIDNRNVSLIPPGVNTLRFRPRTKEETGERLVAIKENLVVGFGPRLEETYGPADFITASAMVSKRVSDVSFVMVGNGSLRQDMEKLATQLGSKIEFVGDVPYSEMPYHYSTMDVYVSPCPFGQGVSTFEAMASGIPVIGYNSGIVKIVNGVDGFLVEPGNIEELAEKILYLLQNPDVRIRMGKRARERVASKHGMIAYVNSHLEIYDKLSRVTGVASGPQPDCEVL